MDKIGMCVANAVKFDHTPEGIGSVNRFLVWLASSTYHLVPCVVAQNVLDSAVPSGFYGALLHHKIATRPSNIQTSTPRVDTKSNAILQYAVASAYVAYKIRNTPAEAW
jgi:hypothetical protein